MTRTVETDFSLEGARRRDADAPLRDVRSEFAFPRTESGDEALYFCGNSLGLQPKAAATYVQQEMEDWARLGVEGHFKGQTPWYSYHEVFRDAGARLVGARPGEVVMMNSLTVNLHLMMVSFFQPEGNRTKIVMEWPAFPSDIYAIKTHLRTRGLDPDEHLIMVEPMDGDHTVGIEQFEGVFATHPGEIALLLVGGVNFLTGQLFDIAGLTQLAHRNGALAGFDLAHAAGNIDLQLHDADVDFACWCSYKYLNAGPGAIAGCFVHKRHAKNTGLPRFGGWWGNDPETRFQMHLIPEFVAKPDADGWQLSNPPILAMAPLRASLELFDRAGMSALRDKSLRMTTYLRDLIEKAGRDQFEIITPRNDAQHGAQLSILVHERPRERHAALTDAGIICDFREPNIIRVAPVPLYNSFEDCWRFAETLKK